MLNGVQTMELNDLTSGGIGAVIGAVAVVCGFRSRMDTLEKEHIILRMETQKMFKEIRSDIKKLIAKTAERREE